MRRASTVRHEPHRRYIVERRETHPAIRFPADLAHDAERPLANQPEHGVVVHPILRPRTQFSERLSRPAHPTNFYISLALAPEARAVVAWVAQCFARRQGNDTNREHATRACTHHSRATATHQCARTERSYTGSCRCRLSGRACTCRVAAPPLPEPERGCVHPGAPGEQSDANRAAHRPTARQGANRLATERHSEAQSNGSVWWADRFEGGGGEDAAVWRALLEQATIVGRCVLLFVMCV